VDVSGRFEACKQCDNVRVLQLLQNTNLRIKVLLEPGAKFGCVDRLDCGERLLLLQEQLVM
jgi:hypothetical protein